MLSPINNQDESIYLSGIASLLWYCPTSSMLYEQRIEHWIVTKSEAVALTIATTITPPIAAKKTHTHTDDDVKTLCDAINYRFISVHKI